MTKQQKALQLALSLHGSARQFEEINKDKAFGWNTFTYWMPNRSVTTRDPKDFKVLANKIAKSALERVRK